jgi:hypothetical protein
VRVPLLLYLDQHYLSDIAKGKPTRLDLRHGCEVFTGRRLDIDRLRERLERFSDA